MRMREEVEEEEDKGGGGVENKVEPRNPRRSSEPVALHKSTERTEQQRHRHSGLYSALRYFGTYYGYVLFFICLVFGNSVFK